MSTDAPSTGRLGVHDWVNAALDIMVEEGISGVKIHRLCERLGVTKGSFYWHFTDLDAFMEQVAKQWAADGGVLPDGIKLGPDHDAASNLLLAMQAFVHPRNRRLARAMRDWSQHDERARRALANMDGALLQLLERAFADLGFDADESELRAKILYYVGVGFGHVGPVGNRNVGAEQLLSVLELLTRRRDANR